MKIKIGVICGMEAEAEALGEWRHDARVFVGVSGARPDQAEALAVQAAEAGAKTLVSWGLAGGLAPDLRSGTLIEPDCVIHPDGSKDSFCSGSFSTGSIAGSDEVKTSPAKKSALREATGASAVDMESHRLAAVAKDRDLDLIIIRAISDPADRALPALAANALGSDGKPRIGQVLVGLLKRPWQLPSLLAAKRDSDKALATLRSASERIEALVNM